MTLSPRRRSLLAVVLLAAGCATPVGPTPSQPNETSSTPATASPSSSPLASEVLPSSYLIAADLDGLLVDPSLAHRLPLAVSIDDARVARPQSGFNAASIVWQAPADGYEVRYLMLFQEQDAAEVGPVRSTRTYLAQWASEERAGFAHYGGDRLGLAWVKTHRGLVLTDVDGIGAGGSAYHRVSTRTAPHNAFTSTAKLRDVAIRLGAAETISAEVHLRPFRDDAPQAARGTSQQVVIPYRTVTVGYRFDPTTNAYYRTLNGSPHLDSLDGRQVTARTVVVLFQTFRTDSTIEPGHSRPVLGSIGSGDAWVFSEGRRVDAEWS
ncbi:MAG: DUF3048 domain-containing protein, partial [Chloroflexota bacterium]